MFEKKKQATKYHDYLILSFGLLLGLFLYITFVGNKLLQASVVVATSLFYILWGIIHHAKEGDFHIKIVLEYLLYALLATALMLTLLYRT